MTQGEKNYYFFSLKNGEYQKEMCYVHIVSDFNTMWYVTSKHSGFKQHLFIYSCFCSLDRAQLGWLISAPCGDWIHSCVVVSYLVPMVSLPCPAIGRVAWFSFAWLSRTAWAFSIALAASQVHIITLNPLKYFTPFPGPFSVLPGEMSQMFTEKILPLKLSCSASCWGVLRALHVLQHGRVAMAALSYHMSSSMCWTLVSLKQCGFDERWQHCSFPFELLFYRGPQAGLLCSQI